MNARSRPGRLVFALCTAVAAGACGDDAEADLAAQAGPSAPRGERTRVDWSARLDPEAAPATADVLAALAQDHAQARRVLGPHRLTWEAKLSLVHETAPADEAVVGQRVVPEQNVTDSLVLEWAARTDESEPRFRLEQHNDHDRGREVMVVDGTIYVRPRFRGWTQAPLEIDDAWMLWLDDAQRGAHDIVELAAPRLRLVPSARPGEGIGGGDAIAVALELGDGQAAPASATGRAWRARARIDAVEGEIVLDRGSGLWLSCDVVVRYGLDGADGQPLRGEAHVRGSVAPAADGAITLAAPAGAEPGSQRIRYELEREELLEGLVGP